MLIASSLVAFGIFSASALPFSHIQSTAQAIAIQDNRATADYWVGKNKSGEAVFIATADLDRLNMQIQQKSANTIVDLAKYPDKVYTQWIKNKIRLGNNILVRFYFKNLKNCIDKLISSYYNSNCRK